jgi:hypothetical protein
MSLPSVSNVEKGKVYCFHSGPAVNDVVAGGSPLWPPRASVRTISV